VVLIFVEVGLGGGKFEGGRRKVERREVERCYLYLGQDVYLR
jgi:hypothetical protein